MKNSWKFTATLVAAFLVAGVAQSANGQPVAYVYVAGSAGVWGYSAAANGQLTPLPGLPVPGSVTHLSTTSKTLFGPGADNQNIYSFNIGPGGALTPGPVAYVQQYNTNGCAGTLGPTQIDYKGKYLYSLVTDCYGNVVTQVYYIQSGGVLSNYDGWYTQIYYAGPPNPIRLLGTNDFAFITGCAHYGNDYTPTTRIFNLNTEVYPGGLYPDGTYEGVPEPSDAQDFYCPAMLTGDPSNHLAYAFRKFYPSINKLSTPYFMASYTVDSQGNFSTESNYTNMPAANIGTLSAMSISPSGKFLAVAGSYGFELFHFNGGSPVTKIGSLVASNPVTQVCWDKEDHLYVLATTAIYVYTATDSGVLQAPGSPYVLSGGGPYSMIALSLTH